MAFKLVISNPKDGKSYQSEFEDTSQLVGKKLGDKVEGSHLGASGYEFEITGGSDQVGNAMRKDVHGSTSRRLLLAEGPGFKPKRKGLRVKKRVHGNTISNDIIQVNLKVIKSSGKKLEEIFKKAETQAPEGAGPSESEIRSEKEGEEGEAPAEALKEAPAEEKKEEAPKEEPKEESKEEEKPAEEEKAEEPKEEKAEEPEPEPQPDQPEPAKEKEAEA